MAMRLRCSLHGDPTRYWRTVMWMVSGSGRAFFERSKHCGESNKRMVSASTDG
jgi:hypothetical protein